MADITEFEMRVPGVNQDTHFQKQNAYLIDCEEHSGVLTVGTHDLVKLNKGDMLTKLRIVVLKSAASSGSATIQFKAKFNSTAENIHANAFAIANLCSGDVYDIPVSTIKGYDEEYPPVIQMSVGTDALTAFKFLLIAETIPVHEFLNKG